MTKKMLVVMFGLLFAAMLVVPATASAQVAVAVGVRHGFGVVVAPPAPYVAYDAGYGYYAPRGYYDYRPYGRAEGWRAREWREHEWREHEWRERERRERAYREHERHEHGWR